MLEESFLQGGCMIALVLVGVVVLFALIVFFSSVFTVNSGNAAVIQRFFGKFNRTGGVGIESEASLSPAGGTEERLPPNLSPTAAHLAQTGKYVPTGEML